MAEPWLRVGSLPATTGRNPYQRLLYGHLASEGVALVDGAEPEPWWMVGQRGQIDALHLHWRLDRLVADQPTFGPALSRDLDGARAAAAALGRRLDVARRSGLGLIWTVHEIGLVEEGGDHFHRLAAAEIGRRADVVLTHNHTSAERVTDLGIAPPEVVHVTPLGHYGSAHPRGIGHARTAMGIGPDRVVLLAFGHQRADKHIGVLLDAFARVDDPGVVLLVAGDLDDPSVAARVGRAAERDPRVRVIGAVPDEQVVGLHEAADVAVIARGHDWTPSSLVLALSHGLPVVAADLPTVAEHGGPGVFHFRPGDVDDLARVLGVVATDGPGRAARGRAGQAFVRASTWADTATTTAAALAAAFGSVVRAEADRTA